MMEVVAASREGDFLSFKVDCALQLQQYNSRVFCFC